MRRALLSVPAFVLLITGCSRSSSTTADAGPPSPPVTASSSAASANVTDAGASACSVDVAPFVIDKGVRGDTGITLAHLPDDRWAVGYAGGDGVPRAAIVTESGTASVVEIDASQLAVITTKAPPKTQRLIRRVTPIAAKDLKMRVAVDFVELLPDGLRFMSCGAADDTALASFAGPAPHGGAAAATSELRDCRSFASAGAIWTLTDEVDRTPPGTAMKWTFRTPGAPADDPSALLEKRALPAGAGTKPPTLDRYGFASLSSIKLGEAGYLVAARSNGKLVMGTRRPDRTAASELSDFWLDAAIGAPALATRDGNVVVLAPIAGKLDLYGASFQAEAKPPKPTKIALDLPAGQTGIVAETERTSLSAALAPAGAIVAAFVDGTPGHRRMRLARFDATFKPREASFEPLAASFGDADTPEVKIALLSDERVLVTALVAKPGAGLQLEGAVLNCGYVASTPAAAPAIKP